jgi:hypothetical protein
MKLVQSILITILLTSCSAQWHIKRATKKNPSILQDSVVFDTVVVVEQHEIRDTFTTTEYDTITLEDSFVYTQVIREKDIIKVYTKCKADTIRITKKLPPQIKYIEQKSLLKKTLDYFVVILLLILLIRISWNLSERYR